MKNILVVTHWGFNEGLIQSYTLPYLRIMHKATPDARIFLLTQEKNGLEKDKGKLAIIQGELEKENIYLVPETYHRLSLLKYFLSGYSLLKHLWMVLTNRVGYIHTFCTPAGGYGYILSLLTGRKLIVDSYEPHSEYMREGGVWSAESFTYKALRLLEKKQATHATHLIATTPSMIEYSNRRFNIDIHQYFVKPACVDLDKFGYSSAARQRLRKELGLEDKIVGVYAGKFGGYYLREEVFEFLQVAASFWKDRFYFLLLSDMEREEFDQLMKKYEIDPASVTLLLAPFEKVSGYLSASDYAFSAYRPAFSKRFCTPIKNGEYWATGLPVVITKDISVDSDIIDKYDIGYVLQDLTSDEYRHAAAAIALLLKEGEPLRLKIRSVAEKYRSYRVAQEIYQRIYAEQN